MGAPIFFALFGVLFVVMAVAGRIYNFYNVTSRDRMSALDITTDGEESDPISDMLGHRHRRSRAGRRSSRMMRQTPPDASPRQFSGECCPYCGGEVENDFDFCPQCGKDI